VNHRFVATLFLGSAAVAFLPGAASAQQPAAVSATQTVQDLSRLSIEELAQLPVQSASKREEPLSRAPTALFVITGAEIAGSGVTSLPEAMRLAPNLQVQQVRGNEYAITARGFNSVETSNKLLVLVDGRSVYSTLQSGVFWDLQTPMLEDIQQIEVISGPGGTLYGPNAVNGVISLISRDARETVGGLARASAGAFEQNAALRYGISLGDSAAVRVYAHYFDRDSLQASTLAPALDTSFRGWQAGFRADAGADRNHFTLQGDIFDNELGSLPEDGNRGHNLLGRWSRTLSETSSFRLQAYYDQFERRFLLVRDSLETFDVEAQYNATLGAHELVLGGGVRTTRDEFINNLNPFRLNPSSRRLWVYNGFVQDRIALSPELAVTVGIKAEETSFTGLELLPNVRLAWQPNPAALFWGAVSRAVRTPSRIDRQLEFLPILARSTNFQSEKLIAFEAGYRGQPSTRTSLSVSLFFNLYDDIRTTEYSPGGVLPIRLLNGLEGHSYGAEAWSSSQLTDWLRLNLGASLLFKDFSEKPGVVDLAQRDSLGHDPNFQLFARAQVDVTDRLQLNAGLRYIDDLEPTSIAGYVEADAALSFRLTEMVELYAAGRNLLHRTHLESDDPQRAQLAQRSVYAGARLRF
jgi:iron complex outermembrane receptor protein